MDEPKPEKRTVVNQSHKHAHAEHMLLLRWLQTPEKYNLTMNY